MNGSLKSLLLLWENLAKHHRYATLIDKEDISTFEKRVENEGLTFMTTTLPLLGKALDRFHSTSEWNPPEHFKCDGDSIPLFMGRCIRLALEGNSRAVDCVRQMSYIFYKLELPFSESVVEEFLERFERIDSELPTDEHPFGSDTNGLLALMADMIRRILCNADPYDIRPCHGSGATACRTPNSDKWHTVRYFPTLDETYSYSDHFFFSPTHLVDELDRLEKDGEGIPRARVCLVPKDSRGPRVISCEPAELMYIQQGIMRLLYETLEKNNLTRGQINFSDQSVNRELARVSSLDGSLATLDLSDASDRVSLHLVKQVFPDNWVECLLACRSEETILPNGNIVKLQKFAPMGSSCCFPVEALVFWACARAQIYLDWGVTNIPVYVYGDDIIVESKFFDSVVGGLNKVGLMVNMDKSYSEGPFRESCGGDYHNGCDVTPVRLRKFPVSRGTGLIASADFLNEIIEKFGYVESHQIIRCIEESVGYAYPRTKLPIPGTLRMNPSASNDVHFRRRWNNHLQRYEHRVLTLVSKVLTKHTPSWGELLRKELTREVRLGPEVPYRNPLQVVDSQLEPGQYADPHSARKSWAWIWLGEPDLEQDLGRDP